jgi:hypothetical protein
VLYFRAALNHPSGSKQSRISVLLAPQTRNPAKPNPATNSKKAPCIHNPVLYYCQYCKSRLTDTLHHLQTPCVPTPEVRAACRFVHFPYLVSCKTLHAPSTLNTTLIPHYNYPATPSKTNNNPQQPPKSSLTITFATTGSGALCPLIRYDLCPAQKRLHVN